MAATLYNIGLSSIGDAEAHFVYEGELDNIESQAFVGCTNLETISIPNAKNITNNILSDCVTIVELTAPGLETYSDKDLFGANRESSTSSLTSITILSNTKNIGTAFNCLPRLTKLSLPTTITAFNANSLSGTSIQSIRTNENVYLCSDCFASMNQLTNISFYIDANKTSKNIGLSTCNALQIISCQCTSNTFNGDQTKNTAATTIAINGNGNGIQSIASQAFLQCINLQTIDFSDSTITELPTGAFYGCTVLSSIFMPNSLTSYGKDCFTRCNAFIDINNGLDYTGIKKCDQAYSTKSYNAYGINDSEMVYIGDYAFKNAKFTTSKANTDEVKKFNFSALTILNRNAFENTNLSAISINSTIASIPQECFLNCLQLQCFNTTEVGVLSVPNITAFGKNSFTRCVFDQAIVNMHASIGDNAFEAVPLTSITYKGGTGAPTAFFGSAGLDTSIIDSVDMTDIGTTMQQFDNTHGTSDTKYVVSNWYDKDEVHTVYDNYMSKFFDNTTNKNVTFKFNGIIFTYNSNYDSYICLEYTSDEKTVLSNINTAATDYTFFRDSIAQLPNSTLTVETNAFNNVKTDDQFLNIDFNQVVIIDDGGLSNASYITSITAPNLEYASQSVFKSNQNLSCIDINAVTAIYSNAFEGCTSIESFQNGLYRVQSIGENAFSNCTSLTALNQFRDLTSIGDAAFKGCTRLTSLDFSSLPIDNIGNQAFQNCTSLTSIAFPDSITNELPANIFSGDGNLARVVFKSTPSINSNTLELTTAQPLSVIFDGINQNAVKVKYASSTAITFNSSQLGGLKSGATIYTLDNDYSHPSMIAINDSIIYVVQHPAFIVDTSYKLLSVDPLYAGTAIDSTSYFSEISSIDVNAFKNQTTLAQLHVPSNLFDSLPDGIFNGVGSLTYVRAEGKTIGATTPDATIFNEWKRLVGNNMASNVEIYYGDGYVNKSGVFRGSDPFIPQVIGGATAIVGVDESIARDHGLSIEIEAKYARLVSSALDTTQYIKGIQNFTNVLSIDDYAFSYNNSLGNVVVNNNNHAFDYIGDNAFEHSSVSSIVINISSVAKDTCIKGFGLNKAPMLSSLVYGSNVTNIAASALVDTSGPLTSIVFNNAARLTSIGDAAFANFYSRFPKIEAINLFNCTGLQQIGDYTFYNSIRDTHNDFYYNTLQMPNSLTSIGTAAFAYRREAYTQELVNLLMPNVKSIGPSAFMYAPFLSIDFGNALISIGDNAFAYPKKKYDVSLPSTIQTIGENAFKDNIILNPLNINKNIIKIARDYSALSSVLGVTVEDDYTAGNRQGFTDATVISATAGNTSYYQGFAYVLNNRLNFCPPYLSIDIINRTLMRCDSTGLNNIVVPDYLTCIGPSAFQYCSNIEFIKAPIGLSVGKYAFDGCTSLVNIIDSHGPIVDPYPPYYLSGRISTAAFRNCNSLTNILLLSTTTSIGASAFKNCHSLTSVFDEETLRVQDQWLLSSIESYAFQNCSSLTSFDIPTNIKSLGNYAFNGCTSLTGINIHMLGQQFADVVGVDSVSAAVRSKFSGIGTNTTRINFNDITYTPDGQVKVDSEFIDSIYTYQKDGLTLSALAAIKRDDFINSSQNYINLSAISRIDPFVFHDLDKLVAAAFLPYGSTYYLEEIGDFAFSGCKQLMALNGGVISCSTIGSYAFSRCNSLLTMKVSFPDLSSIGQGAFYGTSLNRLELINCSNADATNDTNLEAFKHKIGYSATSNRNPLELPEFCTIYFYDTSGNVIGKYDYLLNDLLHATIDTNRNAITFVNKEKTSIDPLLVVKTYDGNLPILAANTFHATIVGRWK